MVSFLCQVVWKATREIGAASAVRKDGKYILVVKYRPGGNFMSVNKFKENVLPPLEDEEGRARVTDILSV